MTRDFTDTMRKAHQEVYREVYEQTEDPRLVIYMMYEDNELGGVSPINELGEMNNSNVFSQAGLRYHPNNAGKVVDDVIENLKNTISPDDDLDEYTPESGEWHWKQLLRQFEENEDIEAIQLAMQHDPEYNAETMRDKRYNLPRCWIRLPRDARSSTVSYFNTGWAHASGDEVLVWKAAEDENGSHFDLQDDIIVPEDSEYVVEFIKDGDVIHLTFSNRLSGAKAEAVNGIRMLYER